MNIILFGAPGGGKGTQANFLINEFDLTQISTGDMLRNSVESRTELGKQVESFMASGDLVPDNIIFSLITERLNDIDMKKGFIFDGFPRNLKQAQKLDEIINDINISLDFVFHIEVDEKILTSRIENRAKQEKIISSGTKSPLAIIISTFFPSSDLRLTASLSISPVEICIRSNFLIKKFACVPFPAPGAPNKIIFILNSLLVFFS